MLALSALLALAVTALTATTALARVDQTYGVHPDLLNKYEPDYQGKWRCLTTAKVLPWSAVNDDYCDCEDGSDEPGMFSILQPKWTCDRQKARRNVPQRG
jgi:protein kinase C substrate 80K-H